MLAVSRPRTNTSHVDGLQKNAAQEYYDTTDPFIDDSELAVDERTFFAQTKQQGFYVSSGQVALLTDKCAPVMTSCLNLANGLCFAQYKRSCSQFCHELQEVQRHILRSMVIRQQEYKISVLQRESRTKYIDCCREVLSIGIVRQGRRQGAVAIVMNHD